MEEVIVKTEFPELRLLKRGKVRDIYDLGDNLLFIATDRISAFDVVLPDGIPGKGRVLTQISIFWFKKMEDIIPNQIIETDVGKFPEVLKKYSGILKDRSMIVKKAQPLPVECVVRGYLAGSGWKNYEMNREICGNKLPDGLVQSSKLEEPIFTPTTKEEQGHDKDITFGELKDILGLELAYKVKELSLRIYKRASEIAEKKGIIIADTKFEFGRYEDNIILIDELLTPDSSRFWSMKGYKPGKSQDSYDKQIVRDYLLTLKWDKTYPGPHLPENIIKKTSERYKEILEILTKVD
jgi:phosphoribosylaminoimidazole-succinocarboxamide synthase